MCKGTVSDLNLFSQAAKKWKVIGSHLNIPEGSLDAIQRDSPGVNEALLAVFTSWRRNMWSTYSWKTILNVLATDLVGHRRLANDIAQKLFGEKGGFVFISLHFSHLACCNSVLRDSVALV